MKPSLSTDEHCVILLIFLYVEDFYDRLSQREEGEIGQALNLKQKQCEWKKEQMCRDNWQLWAICFTQSIRGLSVTHESWHKALLIGCGHIYIKTGKSSGR